VVAEKKISYEISNNSNNSNNLKPIENTKNTENKDEIKEENSGEIKTEENLINSGDTEDFGIDLLKSKWNLVLEKVKKKKMYVFSYLESVKEFELKGSKLILFFPSKFHRDGVHKNKDLIEGILTEMFGKTFVVGCEIKTSFDESTADFFNQQPAQEFELPSENVDENTEEIPAPKDEDNQKITEDKNLRYTPDEILEKEKVVKDILDIFDGDLLSPDR
jgi:hypothetical protein